MVLPVPVYFAKSYFMQFRKSEFYLQYTDVLVAEKLDKLLQLTATFKDLFTASKTIDSEFAVTPNIRYKKSLALNHKYFPEYKNYFKELLLVDLPSVCSHIGIGLFEMDDIQIQLTASNDGDYNLWHKDKAPGAEEGRMITFVYYFNFEPKRFTGGELVIYPDGSKPVMLQPENNTLVLFDPLLLHEVKPVSSPGEIFENSRFTLTGWIMNKTPAATVDVD